MFGLNPGKVERQVHDEVLTRWVYKTTDSVDEILSSENYLVFLNHSPAKIQPGDEILIQSKDTEGNFVMITCIVGYNKEKGSFIPIFTQSVDIYTGKVSILTGLEDYLADSDEGEADAN